MPQTPMFRGRSPLPRAIPKPAPERYYRLRKSSTAATAAMIALLVAALSLSSKPRSLTGDRSADAARRRADAILVRDAGGAEAELARRLAAAIDVRDGFLVVRDPLTADIDMAIMPKTAPWVAHCGVGFLIAFGSETRSAAVELVLTDADIDQKICAVLAPRLAMHIRMMLNR